MSETSTIFNFNPEKSLTQKQISSEIQSIFTPHLNTIENDESRQRYLNMISLAIYTVLYKDRIADYVMIGLQNDQVKIEYPSASSEIIRRSFFVP